MKEHKPDGWTILRYTAPEQHCYKIFATWRWASDRWRLSSGAVDFSEVRLEGDHLIWPQSSGSVYHLPIGDEHCMTAYQGTVLDNLIKTAQQNNATLVATSLGEHISMDELIALNLQSKNNPA